MKKIVLTGGHHSSALPVIKELKRRYPKIQIYWLGHKYSLSGSENTTLEYQEITKLDIPFYNLQAGKFYKTLNPVRLFKIPFGFLHSLYLLLKIRPQVILSFGGYLAVPAVLTGKLLKIPSVTHEQTTVAGYANRLISKFADKILYTWPQSEEYLPKNKSKMVGLPLREEIFQASSNEYKVNKDLPTLYITAGKTGSHIINMLILNNLEMILKKFNLIHQTGAHTGYKDFENLVKLYQKVSQDVSGRYFPRKFIYGDTIGEAFKKSDFLVTRAGAHICYEVIALNKPAIFIPIPWVSHNEQLKNAQQVKKLGLGEILPEEKINEADFVGILEKFSQDLENYNLVKEKIIVKNSAEKIVDETEKIVKKKKTKRQTEKL